MRFLLLVLILASFIASSHGDKILSRKRRYLTFPEGSNFVITLSITKGLMWDVPTGGRPPWNSIVEFDALFKLPNTTLRLHDRKKKKTHHNIYKNVPMEFYYHQHRRDRREVYEQIEELSNIQGMDGRACVQRALCEAKSALKSGRSLLDDILLVIFSMPDEVVADSSGGDGNAVEMSTDACEYWTRSCPISFLQMLLS